MCQIHWMLASIGQMYYMYSFQLYYSSSWNSSNTRQCCWPTKLNMFKYFETHGQLVEVNSVEGEVLVIDWVQGSSNYSSLHLGTLGQIFREQNSSWQELCRKVIGKYGTSIRR